MRIGQFQFRPGLVPTVMTLLLFPGFVSLGLWQLDRAEQKRALITHYKQRTADLPVRLDGSQRDTAAMLNRRVAATGRYDPAHQVLLDNQVYRGRPGYFALTPLRLKGSDMTVLVNRGWVPMGRTRADLPDLGVTEEVLTLAGVVHKPGAPPLALGDAGDTTPGWPKVVQRVDLEALGERLNAPLLPYTLRLAPDQAHGYVRAWETQYSRTAPEKHQAYAVQWFGLALVLLILFVGLNTRRIHRPRRS